MTSTKGTSSRRARLCWAPCGRYGCRLPEARWLRHLQVYPAQRRGLPRPRDLQARAVPQTRRPARPQRTRPAHSVLRLWPPDLPWQAHRRCEPVHDGFDAVGDRRRCPGERCAGPGDRSRCRRHWRLAQPRSAIPLGRALAWPACGGPCCSFPRMLKLHVCSIQHCFCYPAQAV
jgi:hypothetical protein